MRVLLNIVLAVAITYALVLAIVFLFQSRLVYYPNVQRELTSTPRAAGLDYEDVQLRTADNVVLDAWFVPARDARGTVIILHGNAGNISHRIGYLSMFHRLGYSTLLFDYRGYGKSGGGPTEEGTYRDAAAAWLHVVETRKISPGDVVLFGESLGGGIATWLATRYQPRALVLASAFTSVPRLGAEIYPWLPVRWLARIHYDNLERMPRIKAPVLIAHSKDDEIVPYAHGEALYRAAPGPKTLLTLSGGHNESFVYSREEWIKATSAFLARTAPPR